MARTIKNNNSPSTQAGFTLIELIVVASLTVLIMLTVTSMFMTFLITANKANISQVIKSEGENALTQMEFLIKNAQKLTTNLDGATVCNNDSASPMASLGIIGQDGFKTTLQTSNEIIPRIASQSTAIDDYYYLTSDRVTLSNLLFTCLTGADNSFYVQLDFDLKIGTGATADRETAEEHYTSGATLRN